MGRSLKEIVLENFNDVMKQFDLELIDKLKNWEQVELVNNKCIIRFINDSGFIVADFLNPIEVEQSEKNKRPDGFSLGYPVYSVFSVWDYLFPYDNVNYRITSNDANQVVKAIKKVIIERMTNVVSGDFAWTTLYTKHN